MGLFDFFSNSNSNSANENKNDSNYETTHKIKGEDYTSKVRVDKENPTNVTIDKYTKTESGKHIHESASYNKETGNYKHYGGGENADDRSYNKNTNESSSGGGCFITTATLQSLDKPDDCPELTKFREFRDMYLKNRPNGLKEIETYYRVAPVIVAKINSQNNYKEIYKFLWDNYIRKCYLLLNAQENEKAYETYKDCIHYLHQEYLS